MQQQKTVKAMETGGLYLVATPIGNLGDITYRAIEVLKAVDYVLAEDTRVTGNLLKHYGIEKPIVSCHEHNQFERAEMVIEDIQSGKTMALVSDAGMPCISDPGSVMIERLLQVELPFTMIPGASAGITAYALSGMSQEGRFIFHGFLPTKQEARRQELEPYLCCDKPIIFYESPHRIEKLLLALQEIFPGKSEVAVIRELTKLHESITWFTLEEIAPETVSTIDNWRGEIVVVFKPFIEAEVWDTAMLLKALEKRVEEGMRIKDASKEVASLSNQKARDLYQLWEENK